MMCVGSHVCTLSVLSDVLIAMFMLYFYSDVLVAMFMLNFYSDVLVA